MLLEGFGHKKCNSPVDCCSPGRAPATPFRREQSQGWFRFDGKWVDGTTPVFTYVDTGKEPYDHYIYIYYFD